MGRVYLLLIFVFIFHQQTIADQYSIFEKDEKKGLADQAGNILIPAIYDDLGWSERGYSVVNETIGYKMGDFWGLLNLDNIKITPPRYLDIYPINDQFCIASQHDTYKLNSLFGLVSLNSGKTIIPFRYTCLERNGQLLIAGRKDDADLLYGLIDMKGKEITKLIYRHIVPLSDDIFALKKSPDQFLVVDSKGDIKKSIDTDDISRLNSGLFLISKEGQYGIISDTGHILVEPDYSQIKISDNDILGIPSKSWRILSFDNKEMTELRYENLLPLEKDIFKAERKNYTFIIRKNGNILFKIKNADIQILNDSLSIFRPDHGYGVINNHGDIIYDTVYDSIRIHNDRIFLLKNRGQNEGWLIGDLYGTILSSEKYQKILPLNDLFLAIKKFDHWGIADKHGKEILDPIFDTLLSVNSTKFLVKFHGEIGVMDIQGDWKSYPRSGDLYVLDDYHYLTSSYNESYIFDFSGNEKFRSEDYLKPIPGGFLVESYKHKFGLLNHSYEKILPVAYDEIKPLIKDSLFIFRKENAYGTVDRQGKILFENDTRFQEIRGYSEDYIGVKINGEYGFVDCMGRLRIANRYEGIKSFQEGLAHVKILGKWGSVDKRENLVIQPYYDEIEPFLNGLAIAFRDNKYGIIDNTGYTRLSFEYDSIKRLKEGGFICFFNGEAGLIDQEGKLKFYPKFEYINDLQNGYVIVKRKGLYGVLSENGVIKIPIIHDELQYDPVNNVILVSNRKNWELIRLSGDL